MGVARRTKSSLDLASGRKGFPERMTFGMPSRGSSRVSTTLRVTATPARSAVDLHRTYTPRRRDRARSRHDMSGLSPEVQAFKDEGNKNFRVAEYLKAAASYTKALKHAERDGSEQCVAAVRDHHAISRVRVISRAPTRPPLRGFPRASRPQRCEEKPLLSHLTPIAPIVAFSPAPHHPQICRRELAPIYNNRSASFLKLSKVSELCPTPSDASSSGRTGTRRTSGRRRRSRRRTTTTRRWCSSRCEKAFFFGLPTLSEVRRSRSRRFFFRFFTARR